MIELVFIVFNDSKLGYSAVEGKYSMMVVGRDRDELISEVKKAVQEYFNNDFLGKIIFREFVDEELFLDENIVHNN